MFPLLVMMIVLSTIIIPFLSGASDYIGLSNILTTQLSKIVFSSVNGTADYSVKIAQIVMIFLAIFISVWVFCLQCAGAALNYENRSTVSTEEKQAILDAQQAHSQEIGDLLRSRMPNHSR